MRRSLAVGVSEACESPHGLHQVDDPRARCYLRPHSCVLVALVPPVVPDARLGSDRLALTENARLPVSLHCQLALQHSEPLDSGGVLMFSAARRASERVQFHDAGDHLGLRWEFDDRCALSGDGVLPDLADLDRPEIRGGHPGQDATCSAAPSNRTKALWVTSGNFPRRVHPLPGRSSRSFARP